MIKRVKVILQIITILSSISLVFVIVNTILTDYMIIILGAVLFISGIYLLIKRNLLKHAEMLNGSNIEVFFIILAILLAIFLTDGLNSLIFFLVYLLLFGIAILFTPFMVFIMLSGLLVLFIQQYSEQNILSYWLPLTMLLSVTPISYFFGKEFHRREKMEAKIKESANTILSEARELQENLKNSKPEVTEHVDKLVKESSKLQRTTKKV